MFLRFRLHNVALVGDMEKLLIWVGLATTSTTPWRSWSLMMASYCGCNVALGFPSPSITYSTPHSCQGVEGEISSTVGELLVNWLLIIAKGVQLPRSSIQNLLFSKVSTIKEWVVCVKWLSLFQVVLTEPDSTHQSQVSTVVGPLGPHNPLPLTNFQYWLEPMRISISNLQVTLSKSAYSSPKGAHMHF